MPCFFILTKRNHTAKIKIAKGDVPMSYNILKYDPYLAPFEQDITLRMENYHKKKAQLLMTGQCFSDFASGYEDFGLHKVKDLSLIHN